MINVNTEILLTIGIVTVLLGTLILVLGGFKKNLSVSEFMNLGRDIILNLDQYFKKWPIMLAKIFWYVGMSMVLISIALMLFETLTS